MSSDNTSDNSDLPPSRNYVRIKLLSIGNSTVGKSCLIKRYCEKKFVPKYISTIGVDFGVRTVQVSNPNNTNNKSDTIDLKVNFWDLSGDAAYLSIRSEFHSNCTGILLCYDVTNLQSFQSLDNWIVESKQYSAKPLLIAVVACKADCESKDRKVSEGDGKQYANNRNYLYFETSAKDGNGINEMFLTVFNNIVKLLPKQ